MHRIALGLGGLQIVVLAGHGIPVLHARLSTEALDFVYLEEVDEHGNSTYFTKGCLRASNRALRKAPYEYLGLPFHTFYESDWRQSPAGQPIELVFDLLPPAYQFMPGKRLRAALTFADAGNFTTPVLDPVPVVYLL